MDTGRSSLLPLKTPFPTMYLLSLSLVRAFENVWHAQEKARNGHGQTHEEIRYQARGVVNDNRHILIHGQNWKEPETDLVQSIVTLLIFRTLKKSTSRT